MRHSVMSAFAGLAVAALGSPASAHAIFPGSQTVQTLVERAVVRFQAANGRKDVSAFVVEIFDLDWKPYRLAVASPERFSVPPADASRNEAHEHSFSVLVDLGGKDERKLRICTKSVARAEGRQPRTATVNTRVCAILTVRRLSL